MSLNTTPAAERIHIGIFGKRNAGKSSLINAITSQELAIVRKNYGHSFRVEPRRSGAKLARSQEILQYEFA